MWDEKFNLHEKQLMKLETVLDRVTANQDKMADSISSIALSLQKQELLLEKITNLDLNTKDSFARVHIRITDNKKSIDDKLVTIDKKLINLEIVSTLIKYPALLSFIAYGMYVTFDK